MRYKSFLLLLFILFAYRGNAQNARIYEKPSDYLNKQFSIAGLKSQYSFSGGDSETGATLYTFNSDTDKLNEDIKHLYFAIEYHDSMFINCEPFADVPYYAYVIANNGRYLYFTTVISPTRRNSRYTDIEGSEAFIVGAMLGSATGGILGGVAGGLMGVIIKGDPNKGDKFDSDYYNKPKRLIPPKTKNYERYKNVKYSYVYDIKTGTAANLNPDMLTQILAICPELQKQYISYGSSDNNGIYEYYITKLLNMD
ncbi:MAG: hypothetical protein JST82_13155 [Bacteroidetes bacterium]|nr:hypothetical protein [Bacteroidota bacterium]